MIYGGIMRKLDAFLDDPECYGSPSNIWPNDHSWFVYTDWDNWGTKGEW